MWQLAHDRHSQYTVVPFLTELQQAEIETDAITIYGSLTSASLNMVNVPKLTGLVGPWKYQDYILGRGFPLQDFGLLYGV